MPADPNLPSADDPMSPAYRARWNPEEQARIDRDIAAHRQADARASLGADAAGAPVSVEQLDHAFVFGAHLFNYDQLGSDERNRKYKALFGSLFNSATVALYWAALEPEEGRPRHAAEYRDTADYWNAVADPQREPHWRRPPPDPAIAFCESKGVRVHGHPLVWGTPRWHNPPWLFDALPEPYRTRALSQDGVAANTIKLFEEFTADQIEACFPAFTRRLHDAMARRIVDLALRYKGRVHSWDVVNESATDFARGAMVPGSGYCKSHYGPMPGDYAYRAFQFAAAMLPPEALLNINDYVTDDAYPEQVRDLSARGAKIDVVGTQMHLFDPQTCLDIADGRSDRQSPDSVRELFTRLGRTGRPVHVSEITIPSPNGDARGRAIQAVMARNLYRLWFSLEPTMGITWWNVVDGCGAPGEPSVSGLFTRDMAPKPAYLALENLINNEWKTRLTRAADANGDVAFRGFRGAYRLTWRDRAGQPRERLLRVE